MKQTRRAWRGWLACAALACGAACGATAEIRLEAVADHADCRYAAGETGTVTFTAKDADGRNVATGRVEVALDDFGPHVLVPPRVVDLARENPFSVSGTRATPGFLRARVRSLTAGMRVRDNNGQTSGVYHFGLAYDPEKIVSGTPDPPDFDAFWADAIRRLDETVPVDARLERMPERSAGAVDVFRVSFATYGGRRVYGWLTEPKDRAKGPYPVRVTVPGAGIGAVGPGGGADAVTLVMNVHSYPQPEGKGAEADAARRRAYAEQDAAYAKPCGVARYCQAGIHKSREDYFYYASILGINRAVNWLAARPTADKARFSYSGTSQGGGFGLILTALNPHIARSCIFVPALTDLLGENVEGRQPGWPRILEAQRPENRAAAARNAPYFCGVNFARRIRTPIRFVVGFADTTCAPAAVWSAYNACPAADKDILCGVGMGHLVASRFYGALGAWQRQN